MIHYCDTAQYRLKFSIIYVTLKFNPREYNHRSPKRI